jgi:hypothetical protein
MTCLAIAVCARLAFEAVTAQPMPTPPPEPPERTQSPVPNQTPTRPQEETRRVLYVWGKVADEWKLWLYVTRANLKDDERRGFDPSYTVMLSDYKPIVRKLDNGKYTITFTNELAELNGGIP